MVQIFWHFVVNSETNSSLSHCTHYPIMHICNKFARGKMKTDGHNRKQFWPCLTVKGFSGADLFEKGIYLMALNLPPLLTFVLEAQWICW